jgi:predicted AAA+ superfamily ATPase
MSYNARVVDQQLDALLADLPAISIEGAKGVGKTETAKRRAKEVLEFDMAPARRIVTANPGYVTTLPTPLLLDEWQRVPEVWDVIRREVDRDASPGRYLLAGSALPPRQAALHSGAGRIIRMTMRPMTLPERGIVDPAVSLASLLSGNREPITGKCPLGLTHYANEIEYSGLPGIRRYPKHRRLQMVGSYIDEAVERDIPELGEHVRRPEMLRAWLRAYAAATSTTASYTSILNSATPGEDDKPARATVDAYRALLERIWILEPLPAWIPAFNPLKRLGSSPKHQLMDPALAMSLLGATAESLLRGTQPDGVRKEDSLLSALFESLAVLTVRVFAEPLGARVYHLRTDGGEREIDIIVERPDHKVLAIEVKLSAAPEPKDARHLNWLEEQIGPNLLDKVIISTGEYAYRQERGTAVIPLGSLAP